MLAAAICLSYYSPRIQPYVTRFYEHIPHWLPGAIAGFLVCCALLLAHKSPRVATLSALTLVVTFVGLIANGFLQVGIISDHIHRTASAPSGYIGSPLGTWQVHELALPVPVYYDVRSAGFAHAYVGGLVSSPSGTSDSTFAPMSDTRLMLPPTPGLRNCTIRPGTLVLRFSKLVGSLYEGEEVGFSTVGGQDICTEWSWGPVTLQLAGPIGKSGQLCRGTPQKIPSDQCVELQRTS